MAHPFTLTALNSASKRCNLWLNMVMTSRIKHKQGSLRNNGNTSRYNINYTSSTNLPMYFSITKSEYWKGIFISLFHLSDTEVSKWTDTWPIPGRYLTDTMPIPGRYLADTWPKLDWYLADTWPIVDRQLIATYRPMHRLTVDRYIDGL